MEISKNTKILGWVPFYHYCSFVFLFRSETGSLTGSVRGYGTAADSCDPQDGHGHSHLFDHSIHQDIASHSSLRSLLLLFALSLHSVSLLSMLIASLLNKWRKDIYRSNTSFLFKRRQITRDYLILKYIFVHHGLQLML